MRGPALSLSPHAFSSQIALWRWNSAMTESIERDARHKARMARKKALIDEKIAQAQDEYGLLLVHSGNGNGNGNGKGKSSSAFGMVARALGHGLKVGVVQFIKGAASTGEEVFFRRFPDEFSYHVMGEGFTWETQDRQRDIDKAREAWAVAAQLLNDPAIGLVVLDELNIALKYGYLELDAVLADIEARPLLQHVVVTGRGALPGMIEAADTVTEMSLVKHAFKAGVKAQKGVEY
jgi:cob(I)alamin adenosyltransferase